jgi:two-component system response regulator PilR (NtrC family)
VNSPRILVVEDEPSLRDMLAIFFRREGYEAHLQGSFTNGRDAIRNAPEPYALVLTDMMMPDGSGLDIVTAARQRSAKTEVIVMTAHSTVETAIDAMRRGAYDYVAKPFATSELRELVRKALEKHALSEENSRLRAQIERGKPTQLYGQSQVMRDIFALVERIADTRSTVLITDESGTGKGRIARALHDGSERRTKPFLVVDCGAIPEALMESELFGHDKGAFTGATSRTLGIFREADGGTVFLDEVGELPTLLQVKLLRVLQERKVRGVGQAAEATVDVRVVAATNANVEEAVKSGKFRQDLYYRLNVIRIGMPALRERRDDIAYLADYFLHRSSDEHGKSVRALAADAIRSLNRYDFPGNVRELENIIERAVMLAHGAVVGLGDLPVEVAGASALPSPSLVRFPEGGCNLDEVMSEVERRIIMEALERTGGVRTAAAKLIGVTLRSLRYRMQKLSLESAEGDGSESDPPSGSVEVASPSKAPG